MAATKAIQKILSEVLDEYGDRLSIHGQSNVLVSDPSIAKAFYEATESVRTPYGPKQTVAAQGPADPSQVSSIANTTVETVEKLPMDHFTHAVFGINAEDPKYIFAGLKQTRYSLQPKGYAIVISIKQETKQSGEGEFSVSMEDKMKYQSKGKINNMEDVLYYADFERGRIRSFQKSVEVDGKKVEAEVLLAMKWDQLNA